MDKNNLLDYLVHVYENYNMAVPKELLEKKAKLAEETNRVTSELQEVFAALGDLDEQQQLQVQLQSKQLVCVQI